MADTEIINKLHFLFTSGGFVPDKQEGVYEKELSKWVKRFSEDRDQALYDLGFSEKPGWLDAGGSFLYRITALL